MPEWLLKEENYIPLSDKDTFINKSILSLLDVISRIRAQSHYAAGKFDASAVLKVFFTFVLILLLSLSGSFTFIMVIITYLLLTLSFMPAKEIIKILKVSIVMTLFTVIIMLPAAFLGNTYSVVMIPTKVFATITAVNILSHSTQWNQITGALKRFFVPDLFIFVLDITIKYIVMLGEFSLEMLYALKLRSVGKNRSKYLSLSGVAGTMFIRSKEMSEEMYAAMECRGFTGEYRVYNRFRLRSADIFYIAINAGILAAFLYLNRG